MGSKLQNFPVSESSVMASVPSTELTEEYETGQMYGEKLALSRGASRLSIIHAMDAYKTELENAHLRKPNIFIGLEFELVTDARFVGGILLGATEGGQNV